VISASIAPSWHILTSSKYLRRIAEVLSPPSLVISLLTSEQCFPHAQFPRYSSLCRRTLDVAHSNKPQAFRAATRASTARPLPSARFLTPFQARLLSDEVRSAIDRAVASSPVVLFMKGTPETPQCGFSRASIQILGMQGVDPDKFTAFNVLEDQELRAGMFEVEGDKARSVC
jgi:hypothetical protein